MGREGLLYLALLVITCVCMYKQGKVISLFVIVLVSVCFSVSVIDLYMLSVSGLLGAVFPLKMQI